jgi:hypothetical protein
MGRLMVLFGYPHKALYWTEFREQWAIKVTLGEPDYRGGWVTGKSVEF